MDYINGLTSRGFCRRDIGVLATGWHKTKSGSWICIDPTGSATPHDLKAALRAAIAAADKQETVNPQASLKYTRKH